MTYQEMKTLAEGTKIPARYQLSAPELKELIEKGTKHPEELFDIITTVYTCGYSVGCSRKVQDHE